MKKIISLFALLWIATSCIPSEKSIKESLTKEAIPACVDIAGVMDYFRLDGYSEFSEVSTQSEQSLSVLNELDSEGYGRMLSVRYSDSCVYQIKAIIKYHLPASDAEINKNANFLATVTGAGLTSQQLVVLGKWFDSQNVSKLLDQAYKNGKVTSSVHLSPPFDNPFAEMTYEFFSGKYIYTYIIVF